MAQKPIVVVGSSNIDLVVKADRIPVIGETLSGTDFFMIPGGKGANQAVAAAKLGAEVIFVARLGDDIFAEKSLDNFKEVNLNTKYIEKLTGVASGVALISIDNTGRNAITVVPGANAKLFPSDIDKAESDIANAGVVVCQLETRMETVERAAFLTNKHKVPFILDPAPAQPLSQKLLSMVDVLKPNEIEAQGLTGIEITDNATALKAAQELMNFGVETAIITLGSRGVLVANGEKNLFIDRLEVEAVDSTAAGDSFTGGLAFGLSQGKDIFESAKYANYVAALSVTKLGAQSSLPTKDEVDQFISSC